MVLKLLSSTIYALLRFYRDVTFPATGAGARLNNGTGSGRLLQTDSNVDAYQYCAMDMPTLRRSAFFTLVFPAFPEGLRMTYHSQGACWQRVCQEMAGSTFCFSCPSGQSRANGVRYRFAIFSSSYAGESDDILTSQNNSTQHPAPGAKGMDRTTGQGSAVSVDSLRTRQAC